MAKVELKQPIIDEISASIDGAQAALIVKYLGVTVDQDTAMRKELRESGVVYKVYKNTLMKRAFEGTDFAQLDSHLEGPNALAVSKDDAVAPARILAKYVKDYKPVEFVGGVVEGKYYDAAQLAELAKVPTREVLLGRLFGSMQSPIANFARVVKQIAEKDAEPAAAAE
ncbi:MAG: 50S ribosomal protein L10 [Lachnospiraceae bacterium]|nr:50S ribosomal protein L10 [Lachnospiraceae bacterium]